MKWKLIDHHSNSMVWEQGQGPQLPTKPAGNIVLLNVGHTGSSVVAGLLSLLGWKLPQNDLQFNEPEVIRAINDELTGGGSPDLAAALADLPRP